MEELSGIEKALDAALTADSAVNALVAGRIYSHQAPQGATLPYVLYAYQAGGDLGSIGQDQRILTRPLYLVKAVTKGGSFSTAGQIMDAVDAVLNSLRTTAVFNSKTYRILGMYRETPIRYVEQPPSGERLNHAGGSYRVHAHHEP